MRQAMKKVLTIIDIIFILARKEVVMSVKDFYNSCTPGSSITHGVGRGIYTLLTKDEVTSSETFAAEKLPLKPHGQSLLNEVSNFDQTYS